MSLLHQPTEAGGQPLPDLFYVSWLGMTPGQIDCHVFVLRGKSGLLLIDCGTPGHTRGCLSFLIEVNGAQCLFSGDLVMHNGFPGWNGDPGYNAAEIVASLKRLLRVDFQHLCFGHGALMDERGRLFRDALDKAASGEWERQNISEVPVRKSAARQR